MSTISTQSPPLPAKRKPMARRALKGGPWDGRGITIPEADLTLECGWMSGQYHLQEDGTMEFQHHTGGCERPYS